MSRIVEVDVLVLGGLPLLAKTSISPAEPDVGIMGEYVDEVILCWRSGSEVPQSIYDRMKEKDWELLYEDLLSYPPDMEGL